MSAIPDGSPRGAECFACRYFDKWPPKDRAAAWDSTRLPLKTAAWGVCQRARREGTAIIKFYDDTNLFLCQWAFAASC